MEATGSVAQMGDEGGGGPDTSGSEEAVACGSDALGDMVLLSDEDEQEEEDRLLDISEPGPVRAESPGLTEGMVASLPTSEPAWERSDTAAAAKDEESDEPSMLNLSSCTNDSVGMAEQKRQRKLELMEAIEAQLQAFEQQVDEEAKEALQMLSESQTHAKTLQGQLESVEQDRDLLHHKLMTLSNEAMTLREENDRKEEEITELKLLVKQLMYGSSRHSILESNDSCGSFESLSSSTSPPKAETREQTAKQTAGSPNVPRREQREQREEQKEQREDVAGAGGEEGKLKRISVLRKLGKTAFNPLNQKHSALMQKLLRNCFQDDVPANALAIMGFEASLEAELEQTGVLGLLTLVYFSGRYTSFLLKIVHERSYPFAKSALAVTARLESLLDLQGHKVSSEVSSIFLQLMETHPKTFEELCCAGIRFFDKAMKDSEVTEAKALQLTGQKLRSVLGHHPKTLEDLMRMVR